LNCQQKLSGRKESVGTKLPDPMMTTLEWMAIFCTGAPNPNENAASERMEDSNGLLVLIRGLGLR